MLRLYHILLGAILLSVLTPVGFVKYALPYLSSNNKLQPSSVAQANAGQKQAQTTSGNSQPNEGNIWKSILGKTAAPYGWRVAACDGNAPLLCVSSNRKILGTVEMGVYPLENQPNFQQMLAKAGIPPSSKVDYQSPKYQTQLASALKLWVSDHYSSLEKDRRGVYGDRIVFSAQSPQQVPFGKLQGMRYGFSGIKRGGGLHEQHLGYVAFDGKALYVITTAFDPASETGKFEKLGNFQTFEPYLSTNVKGLSLPK
ncbi:hypothetical protein [Mastigocladopsis repens]|uniref:hypothetical protein n=1 Tax=Mastigocladopsis repens TaxID=221287 RepID=UPI0002FC0C5F|nr:hypothetical protein [Mastigocladopsis repens]